LLIRVYLGKHQAMKTYTIEITHTELDQIAQALSVYKQEVIVDREGVFARKMKTTKDIYLLEISKTLERFAKMSFNDGE
jgi:hypothetical protein